MRTIISLLFFLLFVLLAGALIAVPIYKFLHPVIDLEFQKLISHVTSLCGLLSVFIYLKLNNILTRETAGYAIDPSFIKRDLLAGILAGIGIMIVLEALLLVMGVHQFEVYIDTSLDTIIIVFVKAILTGMVVGLIEETLFRGALLGGLRAKIGATSAVITSSVIYSAVHFLKYRDLPVGTEINWYTGLEMLPKALCRLSDPASMDLFLSLFAFGVLLSLVRLKNGNIIQCIGIHAGAVSAIKLINYVTDYAPGNSLGFFVNKHDHLLGHLAFIWLVIITLIYYRYFLKRTLPVDMNRGLK